MKGTAVAVLVLAAAGLAACGGESGESSEPVAGVGDPGPIHVHGLGVNPADGGLFVATTPVCFAPRRASCRRVVWDSASRTRWGSP